MTVKLNSEEWISSVQGSIFAQGEASPTSEGGQEANAEEAKKEPSQAGNEAQPAAGEGEAKAQENEKPIPWFTRRIDELTRKRREAERKAEEKEIEAEALKLQLAELKTKPKEGEAAAPPAPNSDMISRTEAQRMAKEEAAALAAQQEFIKACNDTYEKGVREFKDFNERIGELAKAFGDGTGVPPQLTQAAIDTGEPAKVLHALGGDLDEAARILSLSPTKMASELTKLSLGLKTKQNKVSEAPPPITPTGGRAKAEFDPTTASTAEWMAWREKDIEAKRKAGVFIQ